MRAPHLGKHHPDEPRPDGGGELTGSVRSVAQTLAFGGLVMALLASLGLSALDQPPPVLVTAALLGLALMLFSILLMALFLPVRQSAPATTPETETVQGDA